VQPDVEGRQRRPPAIEAYGAGGFRIEGVRHEGSVLILGDVARPWPIAALDALSPADLETVFAFDRAVVEFVLLGSGPAVAPPPKAVREACREAGLGLEVMTTPEAVRLYNVLASDGRRLAAALIAV
jgi:uncharacterized protein